EDVYGSSEEEPTRLLIAGEPLAPGIPAALPTVEPGTAVPLATGAMMPRGANAVVMIEYTDVEGRDRLLVKRPVTPGTNLTCAGTDIGQGETVLRRGELLGARETGVLAALGLATAWVVRRP